MDKKRILVVDDQEMWLRTVQLILGAGYEFSLTRDPDEAISLCQSHFYSLAILDQRISATILGLDLLKQLRAIQADLRCIILTGYAELDDAVRSMQRGAVDYLSKGRPGLASELQDRVARILEEQSCENELLALLRAGESSEVEFKESLRWDTRLKKVNKELEAVTVRTVAALLNTESGGILLIGVDDGGQVKGLQADFATLKRQDRDGFENLLVTILIGAYGKDVSPLFRVDFPQIDGVEICRVSVKPCHRPVYVPDAVGSKDLYIRSGNSTRRLNTEEAIEYSKVRWIR